jgi:cytochrome c oxidase subunit 4
MSIHEIPAEHVVPRSTYFAIFAVLMILTAVTVWVAFHDLGPLNVVVALVVAVTKAALVILYFMHVRYSSRLTQTIVVGALLFFLIFVVLTFADYLTRGWDLRSGGLGAGSLLAASAAGNVSDAALPQRSIRWHEAGATGPSPRSAVGATSASRRSRAAVKTERPASRRTAIRSS